MHRPSLTRRLYLPLIVALGAFAIFGVPQTPAHAADKIFTVNSTVDAPDATPGDGACETATGNNICTLRAAIMEANALAGANTIDLAAGVTYALTRSGNDDSALDGDLDITGDLTINRVGASNAIIDANLTDRIFDIHSGVITISGVTLTHGSAHEGGAIQNNGTLTLNSSTITNNTAYTYGGGIYNYGTLTLNNSLVSGNMDIGPTANGGGIFNGNNLTVVNSTISGNTAGGGGGGVANFGTAIFTNSTISGNSGPYGGGIRNNHHLTLTQSTLSSNTATSLGGGFFNEGSAVANIAGSTLSSNTSLTGGAVEN
jgi:large repetitive protein